MTKLLKAGKDPARSGDSRYRLNSRHDTRRGGGGGDVVELCHGSFRGEGSGGLIMQKAGFNKTFLVGADQGLRISAAQRSCGRWNFVAALKGVTRREIRDGSLLKLRINAADEACGLPCRFHLLVGRFLFQFLKIQ